MMCMPTLADHPGEDMNIGKSLKIALIQNNMEQADLADRMGIHQSNISKISRGKTITTETLQRIAKAFNMKVSEFLAIGED